MSEIDHDAHRCLYKIVFHGARGSDIHACMSAIAQANGATLNPTSPAENETATLELSLGQVRGYQTDFLLMSVPTDEPSRLLVLKGVDAVVFVGTPSEPEAEQLARAELAAHLRDLLDDVSRVPIIDADLAEGGAMASFKAAAKAALTIARDG